MRLGCPGGIARQRKLCKKQQLLQAAAQSLVERSVVSRFILHVKKLMITTAMLISAASMAIANKLIQILISVTNSNAAKNMLIFTLHNGTQADRLF